MYPHLRVGIAKVPYPCPPFVVGTSITQHPYALIVIDGMPVQQSAIRISPSTVSQQSAYRSGLSAGAGGPVSDANLDYIDPRNVESVTVLKGLAATNMYGTLGANGVILITTKTGSTASGIGNKKSEASGLPNNTYAEANDPLEVKTSSFYGQLSSARDEEEAYILYLSRRILNKTSPFLYWDAFTYFKTRNQERAARILSNLIELYPENYQILKSVELAVSTLDMPHMHQQLNDQLLELEPGNRQALLNKALLLAENKQPQRALNAWLALQAGRKFWSWQMTTFAKA